MLRIIFFIGLVLVLVWLFRRTVASPSQMSAEEAAKLLDIKPDADADAINAAHKRLIAKVHPDAGGTAELAKRINLARDTLLRRLPR